MASSREDLTAFDDFPAPYIATVAFRAAAESLLIEPHPFRRTLLVTGGYLGYNISPDGVRPSNNTALLLTRMPMPTDIVRRLRALLGGLNFS